MATPRKRPEVTHFRNNATLQNPANTKRSLLVSPIYHAPTHLRRRVRHHVREVQAELRVRLEGCQLLHAFVASSGFHPFFPIAIVAVVVVVVVRGFFESNAQDEKSDKNNKKK